MLPKPIPWCQPVQRTPGAVLLGQVATHTPCRSRRCLLRAPVSHDVPERRDAVGRWSNGSACPETFQSTRGYIEPVLSRLCVEAHEKRLWPAPVSPTWQVAQGTSALKRHACHDRLLGGQREHERCRLAFMPPLWNLAGGNQDLSRIVGHARLLLQTLRRRRGGRSGHSALSSTLVAPSRTDWARSSCVPYITNDLLLALEELPTIWRSCAGGFIALDFAQVFRCSGSELTVLEQEAGLLAPRGRCAPALTPPFGRWWGRRTYTSRRDPGLPRVELRY